MRSQLFAPLLLALALGAATTIAAAGAHSSAHAASGQPAPSVFGINTGTFDSSHARFVKDMPTAKKLGARWVHFTGGSVHWTRGGRADFGALDYEVSHARKLGLGVLVSLGGDRSACSVQPRPAPNSCPPTTAHDLKAYQQYLRVELRRYRTQVAYWESWVEPNQKASWAPAPDPGQYAQLLRAEWAVVQSVNKTHGLHLKLLFGSPNDFSIIPGSPGGIAALPYTHAVLQALHGAKVFDGIALHAYRYPPATTGPSVADYDSVAGIPKAAGSNGPYPDQGCSTSPWCRMTWPQELSAYEQEFANQGYGQTPLWLTEFGWPGNANAGDKYHPDYATQAQDLTRAYNDVLGLSFMQAAFWFNLRDYQPGLKNPDPEFFAHYGLLENNFTAKPAATAWKQLAAGNPRR